ncbi:MAG TPA: RNA 2',3'-cyclic phosphodiesterase, partial [Firmicutes bacterium]|nr:RNA 2',3'-cyclic phosphodiesterase [Bacillota bacterium]
MRLFTAIALSETQKKEVVILQNRLKSYLNGVRWVRPEALHLTLKFLGET